MNAQLVRALAVTLALGALATAMRKPPRRPARPRQPETEEAAVVDGVEALALRGIAKRRITREVAAGRVPILQAAAQFGALNRVHPPCPSSVAKAAVGPQGHGRRGEAEALCRQVIAYVEEAALEGIDPRAAARLRRELEGLIAEGPLQLPPPQVEAEVLLDRARADLPELLHGAGRD